MMCMFIDICVHTYIRIYVFTNGLGRSDIGGGDVSGGLQYDVYTCRYMCIHIYVRICTNGLGWNDMGGGDVSGWLQDVFVNV